MASNVLKTLQGLENDRQLLNNLARIKGYNIPEDASFSSLANCITDYTPGSDPEWLIPYDVDEDWSRPSEWPDTKSILANTPKEIVSSGTYYPFVIFLLKDDSDTITIDNSASIPNSSISRNYHMCNAFKTSDGEFITVTNSAGATHTWDKSQDIIISEGEYAGTYRYLIGYMNNNNGGNSCIYNWPVVEIIVSVPDNYPSWYNPVYSAFIGGSITSRSLINYEVINVGTPSKTLNLYSSYLASLSYLPKLRNLNLSGFTAIGTSNSSPSIFQNLYSIRNIDLSHLTYQWNTSNISFDLRTCYNLVSFKGPKISDSSKVLNIYLRYNPKLQYIGIDLGYFRIYCNMSQTLYGGDTYVPSNITLKNSVVREMPRNWNSVPGNKIFFDNEFDLSGTATILYTQYGSKLPVYLDLSNVMQLSSSVYSIYYNGSQYKGIVDGVTYGGVKYVTFPDVITTRLDISNLLIDISCVNDILNKLKDLTNEEEQVYNPRIRLSYYQYDSLTAEMIESVNDKGWNIVIA